MQAGWCASAKTGSNATALHNSMSGRHRSLLSWSPYITLALLCAPVAAGLLGTVLPALSDQASGLWGALAWPGFYQSVWLSVKTGFLATIISLFVTLVLISSLYGTRAFVAVQHLVAPLLSVPHAAAALGLAFLISPSGWVARALSPWATGWTQPPDLHILNDPAGWALIFGLVTKEIPFLFLLSLAALPQTDAKRRLLVAQSLGAARLAAFVVAVLPALYRQIRLPVFAVLAYSATSVEIAMILGPSLPPTLSVQIAVWMKDATLTQQPLAAGAALVQLMIVFLMMAVWILAERLLARGLQAWAMSGARGHLLHQLLSPVGIGLGVVSSTLLILGLAGLSLWSVSGLWSFPALLPDSYSLAVWRGSAPLLLDSSATTLIIAFLATCAALVLTLSCLEAEHRFGLQAGQKSMVLLFLPLIIPQIAFLPGLQLIALKTGIEGTIFAVAFAHLVFVLPYLFLSLAPAFRAWDLRIAVVGASLGASPARVFWTLRMPMLLRAILTAIAVGMAVSIGQYLPTLLIGGGRLPTLTTEAVALSSGGNRRLIGALALLQMVLPAAFFMLAIALPAYVYRDRRAARGLA